MKLRVLLVVATLLPVVGTAASPSVTIRPADRKWEKFGLAERVPVLGDLVDSDCPSVTLLRLRPDTRLPPHSAPVDRTYLLLSGTVRVGIGKKWDEARMRTLPAGSFWVVPADTSTFEWFEGDAVCQVVATRPARDCPRPEEATVFPGPDRLEAIWTC
jgi:quercetin dioxygenase-like cupin family protein